MDEVGKRPLTSHQAIAQLTNFFLLSALPYGTTMITTFFPYYSSGWREVMPERIGYAGSVEVVGGPVINFNTELSVGGYERHTVTIAPTKTGTVSLGTTADIQLLVIESSVYDPAITYLIDPEKKTPRPLDRPIALAGGIAGLFDTAGSKSFTFTNGTAADITIKVLIAHTV